MKFGGSSLASAQSIRNAIKIIQDYLRKRAQVAVVASALSEVTNGLVNVADMAAAGDITAVNGFVEKQREFHASVAKECIRDTDTLSTVLQELDATSRELGGILLSVARLKELTPRSRDFILPFGERMSATILCGTANDMGVRAECFSGTEAGIRTDENFGDASPLMDITIRNVKTKLEPLLDSGVLVVVAGYRACSPQGIATTLGRGGSDYTATIIGAALAADEIVLWKDVDGLMTADPVLEAEARVLATVSYSEASEMAYFGTKAIHPRALEPVIDRKIPIRIRNAFNLQSEGTLIHGDKLERTDQVVKAITLVRKVGMINVTGTGMQGLPGVAARIFKILGDLGVNILMISQSPSEAGISFVTTREKLQRATNALELNILGSGLVKNLSAEDDVCVIAAVGAGMKGTRGVAARVFRAVADAGVNVRMIAQGSSELNISFVVAEKDGPTAVHALHDEFRLAG
jgi:aspartate kinase